MSRTDKNLINKFGLIKKKTEATGESIAGQAKPLGTRKFIRKLCSVTSITLASAVPTS